MSDVYRAGAGTRRVAYVDAADRLRRMVLSGRARDGRLPSESELSVRFGVGRSTIREAIRTLASQGLVHTARGVNGGLRIARPKPIDVSNVLSANLTLLTLSDGCSVAELLETREFLEIPAARLAASRRSISQLADLRSSVQRASIKTDVTEMFEANRDFHRAILEASGNRLLGLVAEPLFTILQSRFLRDRAKAHFWRRVVAEHQAVARAVALGDADAAARAMGRHLRSLRKTYESIDSGLKVGGQVQRMRSAAR